MKDHIVSPMNVSKRSTRSSSGDEHVPVSSPKSTRARRVSTTPDGADDAGGFEVDGKFYQTYQEMVDAKRQRNQRVLEDSGLIELSASLHVTKRRSSLSSSKKRNAEDTPAPPKRKSSRLAGVASDGLYVDNERCGKFTVKQSIQSTTSSPKDVREEENSSRINGGEPVSLRDSLMKYPDVKWIPQDEEDTRLQRTQSFLRQLALPAAASVVTVPAQDRIRTLVQELQATRVAKVVPDRIYSITTTNSQHPLVVATGDKSGHVGFWNVDDPDQDAAVHLFKYHTRPVNTLEWTGNSLFSMSYDGTVRCFDATAEQQSASFAFTQAFVADSLGSGRGFWTQFAALDHRRGTDHQNSPSFFLSTSIGTVCHVDLRLPAAECTTFNEHLSEKKINTIRYVAFKDPPGCLFAPY
jgi:WD40 repeat protein